MGELGKLSALSFQLSADGSQRGFADGCSLKADGRKQRAGWVRATYASLAVGGADIDFHLGTLTFHRGADMKGNVCAPRVVLKQTCETSKPLISGARRSVSKLTLSERATLPYVNAISKIKVQIKKA
jgi:hypothetical protein